MRLIERLRQWLLKPAADPATAALYRACVAQARQPFFYTDLGVPDTVDGRFDMLVLHSVLVMRRLGNATEAKQKLFDLMFADMDRSLREMGVGDMSLPKKIKPMIEAFYGRAQAYDTALQADDNAPLTAALQRNLYGSSPVEDSTLSQMTHYVRHTVAAVDRQPINVLTSGHVVFVAPSSLYVRTLPDDGNNGPL